MLIDHLLGIRVIVSIRKEFNFLAFPTPCWFYVTVIVTCTFIVRNLKYNFIVFSVYTTFDIID